MLPKRNSLSSRPIKKRLSGPDQKLNISVVIVLMKVLSSSPASALPFFLEKPLFKHVEYQKIMTKRLTRQCQGCEES